MATLQEERYDEVVQLLNSRAARSAPHIGAATLNPDGSFTPNELDGIPVPLPVRLIELSKLGFQADFAATQSLQIVQEVLYLDRLIMLGLITEREANGFLQTKYNRVFIGKFRDPLSGGGAKQTSTASELPSEDREAKTKSQEAQELREDIQSGVLSEGGAVLTSPGALSGLLLGSLPEEYDSDEVGSLLEGAFDSIGRNIARVAGGEVRLRQGTIDGAAIIPGTLPATAFQLGSFIRRAQAAPDEDQSIFLRLHHSETIDRWVTETVGSVERDGPGRVWSVTSSQTPPNWNIGLGRFRYRIITPGMRFGVMNVEWIQSTSCAVTYGIVITGIPWFGPSPPQDIEFLAPRGNGCGGFGFVQNAISGGANLYEDEAEFDYIDNPPVAYLPFGNVSGPSGFMYPTQGTTDYTDQIRGFTAQIIKGTTTQETWEELNTRESDVYSHVAGNGVVVGKSCPPNEEIRCPGFANLFDNGGAGIRFRKKDEALTGILVGAPFLYDDCARIRQRGERFSVVLQLIPPRIITNASDLTNMASPAGDTDDMRLSTWYETGIEMVEQNNRRLDYDMVVA